jgi:hypothetical protein
MQNLYFLVKDSARKTEMKNEKWEMENGLYRSGSL